jgi:hypothetical protein
MLQNGLLDDREHSMSGTLPPLSNLDPILLASRWLCGDLLPEDVPKTAIELIEAGREESSVYRVAAEVKVNSRDDVEVLLGRMFAALGVEYPMSLEDARLTVARQIAREVVAGRRDPWTAAARLDRAVPHWETQDQNILDVYCTAEEADWDPGYGRSGPALELELLRAFERLACS